MKTNRFAATAIFLLALLPSLSYGQSSSPRSGFPHYGYFFLSGYDETDSGTIDLSTYTTTGFAVSPGQVGLLYSRGYRDIIYNSLFGADILKKLLDSEGIIPPAGGYTSYDFRTIPGYETKALELYKQYLLSLKNSLSAGGLLDKVNTFYLLDEPALNRNFVPNQNFLNKIEKTFKEVFPGKYSTMAFSEDRNNSSSFRGPHYNPPPTTDIITVDPYFWDNNTTGCSEAEISKYLYETNRNSNINWALQFNKPIFVAGDAMLRNGVDPLHCYVENTYKILKKDSRIQGLFWFAYDKSFKEGMYTGASNSQSLISFIKGLSPIVTPASAPVPAPATPPSPTVTLTPTSGVAPLSVKFSILNSRSTANNGIYYTITFGDGQAGGFSRSAPFTLSHTYSSSGTYTATVTERTQCSVTECLGPSTVIGTATVIITAQTQSPTPSSPGNSSGKSSSLSLGFNFSDVGNYFNKFFQSGSAGGGSGSGGTGSLFGGKIMMQWPCTCSNGLMVLFIGPPRPGVLILSATESKLFDNKKPIIGSWVIGDYKSGSGSCMMIGYPSCWTFPTIGTISRIGTS